MRPLVLVALCLLCSSLCTGDNLGSSQGESLLCDPDVETCLPNGCPSSAPIFHTDEGTCNELPDPNNFTIITDSTSYYVTVPVNELSGPSVILQEFTIYFSPNELNGKYVLNFFAFLLSGDDNLASFEIAEPAFSFFEVGPDPVIMNESNALLFTGNASTIQLDTYVVTLLANPFETSSFPIANFTINVTEAVDPCMSDPCVNGDCSSSGELFMCDCHPGYTGTVCDIELDPCDDEPCDNGGSCTKNSPTEFSCQCSEGYTGDVCSESIDDCEGVSCGNGVCVDQLNGYDCVCNPGYNKDASGSCTIDIDDCASDPCQNGLCQDGVNDFTCNCYPGYTGATCDVDINDCVPFPCDVVGFNSFEDGNQTCHCECRSGFTDESCSTNINDCDPNLCVNNGTCEDGIASYICLCVFGYTGKDCEIVVDLCEDNPCNNGSCTSVEGVGFMCDCNPGYTGNTCEIVVDFCEDNPCNNGNCTSVQGVGFMCDCNPGYTGNNCEIVVDFCEDDPCNNGSCTSVQGVGFMCDCDPGYTGSNCEIVFDFCEDDPCDNGNCTSVQGVGFMCDCDPGYTGENCSEDINECALDPCDSRGSFACMDQVNAFNCLCLPGYTDPLCGTEILDCSGDPCNNSATCMDDPDGFICICPPDYTGMTCAEQIDDCASDPCVNGECVDEITGFLCMCPAGFTGNLCESDVNFCELENPCLNGGSCVDLELLDYNCTCVDGYFGVNCTEDVSVCTESDPCQNNGNCTDGPGLSYSCACPDGFDGDDCEIDIDACESTPCNNAGTCTDGYGLAFNCSCVEGFEGDTCDDDVNACIPNPCQYGGTCQDLPGPGLNFNCSCEPGFSGLNCSMDLDYCNNSYCQNGGTCVDGLGTAISCSCSIDYTGNNCETELTFCTSNICQNEGICMEDAGNQTYCVCTEGFDGEFCEIDKIYCNSTTCSNGGTCMEGYGTETLCMCSSGFDGDSCQNDLNFCTGSTCNNGGTCMEGYGAVTTCQCPDIYTGDSCQTPFCPQGYCNNGTCDSSVDPVFCACDPGYKGEQCQDDIDFCTTLPCSNGGTCVDGPSVFRTCYCPPTFTGENCEVPVCQDDSCYNGGTCSIVDNEIACACLFGFSGSMCENDLDFCNNTVCQNDGICEEGYGHVVFCNCSDGFDGDYCEEDLDFCTESTCSNGGTCQEGYGPITTCLCPDIYAGDQCQTLFCPNNYCNNGTCNENVDSVSCSCFPGYMGNYCEIDINFCNILPCQNGGNCSDGQNTSRMCQCPPTFTGESCETPVCQQDSCENGGSCVVEGNTLTCQCPVGFTGPTCATAISSVCDSNPCENGGTCNEIEDTAFYCVCPENFSGSTCETPICVEDLCNNGGECVEQGNEVICICFSNYTGPTCDTYLPCSPNQCQNGGSCVANAIDDSFTCQCPTGYSGELCENAFSTECTQDSDCANGWFCSISCASDNYPPHIALLSEAINLEGVSYVNIEPSKFPNFSNDITVFIVFKQDIDNEGYLLFYGTSGSHRNFGIFVDNDTELRLYYLTKTAELRTLKIPTNWDKFEQHYLTVSIDISENLALFYLDDADPIVGILDNPDFTALISDTNPASLLVGARIPHQHRFSGQIRQIVIFPSAVPFSSPDTLRTDFDSLVNPTGQCVPYLQYGDNCPAPTTAPSPLCVSATDKCDPTLKCLIPSPGSSYSCQPSLAPCTKDSDCSTGYFCGSELPYGDSNYFENPDLSLPGDNHFLLENTMQFNGEQIVSLSADYQPQISSELTIFAMVTQDADNDGYVVGKGINDRLRDFGLYLRSSQNTVWLAYGADEGGEGFREILFFYDVNIADGLPHTIGAVISGPANRAVLYIDGIPVRQRSPLPSVPTFRPGFNLLYVGGRPGTKRFRFKGTISNLLVSTTSLQSDSFAVLHSDAMDGDGKLSLQSPTSRFCREYISTGSQCELVNGDIINNFRCAAPAECVPIQDSSSTRVLPDVSTQYAVLGRCIAPCDCSGQPEALVCGSDGNTYANSCYRDCAQVTEVHAGAC